MGKSPSEINIIQELVENDKVYELAQSITKNGYLPGEYVFVCKENGKTIVVLVITAYLVSVFVMR